jgi:hypothetical protein
VRGSLFKVNNGKSREKTIGMQVKYLNRYNQSVGVLAIYVLSTQSFLNKLQGDTIIWKENHKNCYYILKKI